MLKKRKISLPELLGAVHHSLPSRGGKICKSAELTLKGNALNIHESFQTGED